MHGFLNGKRPREGVDFRANWHGFVSANWHHLLSACERWFSIICHGERPCPKEDPSTDCDSIVVDPQKRPDAASHIDGTIFFAVKGPYTLHFA